jgi:hypothetical protein
MPNRFGLPVVTLARVLLRFAREAAGAAEHPAFPAPSLSRVVVGKPRRQTRRGIEDLWPRKFKCPTGNHPSSPRKQGPITTGANCSEKRQPLCANKEKLRRMGPRVRGDNRGTLVRRATAPTRRRSACSELWSLPGLSQPSSSCLIWQMKGVDARDKRRHHGQTGRNVPCKRPAKS